MKMIYIAGPYSGESYSDIDDNIRRAEATALTAITRGWGVIIPHKNTAHFDIYDALLGVDYKFWVDMTMELLKRSDAIYMMRNWRASSGARGEAEYAISKDMPAFCEDQEDITTQFPILCKPDDIDWTTGKLHEDVPLTAKERVKKYESNSSRDKNDS